MNGPLNQGEDVALFIDWENFKISLATGRRLPNVSALKEEVSNLGRVVVAKAYADWVTRAPELRGASQFINDPPALYAAGIEPVYVPTRLFQGGSGSEPGRNVRVKNSVDVKMTADCIEIAHSYPNIGTYVLVSGDSDFIHVVNTLRTMGKRVVIIGVSWATSRRLADQVDGLILYDVDVDPVTTPEPVPAANGRAPSRGSGATRPELAAVIQEIEEIVRSERQAGGTPLLTSIKQRLMRRFPGFDEKQLGYSGFKKLMARAAQEGKIKLTTAGLVDWATMADEPPPSESDIEAAANEGARTATGRGRRAIAPKTAPAVEATAGTQGATEEPQELADVAEVGDPPAPTPSPDQLDEHQPEPQPAASIAPVVAALLAEATASLDLPEGPGDGLDSQRITDLIVMADTLEHREGISHVAFNFLVAEVCQALEQGLEAEHEEITQRWSKVYSRAYVSKMFRGLSSGNLFIRGWHSSRDEATGQQRRRRTFNLDRSHPVIEQVLKDRLGPEESAQVDESRAVEPAPAFGDAYQPQETGPSQDDFHAVPHEEGAEPENDTGDQETRLEGSFFSRLFRAKSD